MSESPSEFEAGQLFDERGSVECFKKSSQPQPAGGDFLCGTSGANVANYVMI